MRKCDFIDLKNISLCLAAISSYANPSAGAARPTEAQQTFLSHVSM